MAQPARFIVSEPFRHVNPETVRTIAQSRGFQNRTPGGTKNSEIWTLADGDGGHWIIRIDSMGHDTKFHFGQRPHYHKNWVPSDALLQKYLTKYTPGASVYNDAGVLIGLAGGQTDGMNDDLKAKEQHIMR